MKYIVYITINKTNNKYYIGVHQTNDPNIFDHYLGCGVYANKPSSYNRPKTPMQYAVLKYGPSKFIRHILKIFNSLEEALSLERELVDINCIKSVDTYNYTLGGGYPPVHDKLVYQYDLSGNFIRDYTSIKIATLDVCGVKDAITSAINSKTSYKGYFWSFEKTSKLKISEYSKYKYWAINQFSQEGLLLNTFNSAKEASQKLDIDAQAITGAACGKYKCQGYYFLHIYEDINIILNNKKNYTSNSITPVYRYDGDTGEFIKEYKSISEVKKDFEKANHGNIIRAIKNKSKSLGFRWGYTKVDNILLAENTAKSKKKIAQYDLDGNLIKVWDSVTECRKEFPNFLRVLREERKHCKGYTFKYI